MRCSPPKHEAESDPAPGLTTDWQEILGTEQHIGDAWGFDLPSQPLCEPPGFSNSKGEKGAGDVSRRKRRKHTSVGPVLDSDSNRLRKKEGKKRKKERKRKGRKEKTGLAQSYRASRWSSRDLNAGGDARVQTQNHPTPHPCLANKPWCNGKDRGFCSGLK